MSSKMSTCKNCGAEIAKSAKTCPKCGGKISKPIYKRVWFIVLVVIVVLAIAGSAMNGGSSSGGSTASSGSGDQSAENTPVTYTECTADEMMDALNNNALGASETYDGQYVAVTGRLGNIDSSGKYITVYPVNDEWAIIGVQCYIKTDEQKSTVAGLSTDDIITIKGKITGVGEIMGYSLDIDEIA